MKTVLFILAVLALSSCAILRRNQPVADKGVEINGIRWATRNVGGTPQTFAPKPENAGGHFTWDEAQEACPEGWRLPTHEEISSLADARVTWMRMNDVGGWTFGLGANQIFLPASGFGNSLTDTDTLAGTGESGLYWSSTPNGIVVRYLFFARDVVTANFSLVPESRMSVRCVVASP